MEYIIATHGLTKRYSGTPCVQDLDLRVPEGAVYGFLGPNGAGKTTTLKMLLGLVHPTEGRIELFGREANGRNRLQLLSSIGSLIESPSYYSHLSARENLEIAATLRGLPKGAVDQALSAVRLDPRSRKRVNQFSLGMKQRLGIACALLGRPRLLLLDEPTNGLDPAGIQEMRALIQNLPGQMGMTVVVSSHLLSEIDQLATHVGIIRQGALVFQDRLEALHARGRANLMLRTSDDARALSLLPQARRGEGWLMLPAQSDAQAAQLSLMLAGQGVGVVRMEAREKSLEDLFLELTGGAVSL